MKTYFLIFFFIYSALLTNAQPLKIYIGNDDHDDIMWTANEETYIDAWIDMLDYYLNLANQYQNEPSQYQSRFSADGTLWLWHYERLKTTAQFSILMDRIKDGHITVPKNPTTMTYGGMTAEAVIRSMFYAGELERRFNFNIQLTKSMENHTHSFGLTSLWAGSGCKYSWKGLCNCATFVPGLYNAQRDHEIYWWTGLDNQRILLKWNSLTNNIPPDGVSPNQSIGGYAEAYNPADVVEFVSSNSTFKSRYPYNIIGAFGKGWDNLITKTDEFVSVAKNKSNASRQVIVSNTVDFFQDFENMYGSDLNSFNASFGNEWELEQASLSGVSGEIKRAIEKMRMAEALATYSSLIKSNFMDTYISQRRKAWIDLGTYYNHDWFPYGPITSSDLVTFYKAKASSFTSYIDNLLLDAAAEVSSSIRLTGTNTRFYVFNSLSWERTDYVDLLYNQENVHVIDLTSNSEAPSQSISIDGKQYLRILAEEIPAVGYKVFEIVSGQGISLPKAAQVSNSGSNKILENDYYKLTIAPNGSIVSLIDKTRGNKEFVQNLGGRYLNDLGGTTGSLSVENEGAVSVTVFANSSTPLNHQTRITLYKNVDRIDIRNEITQNFNGTYTWSFGFNLNNPQLWHEEIGAIIKGDLLANGGHYSPKFARYDWFSMNHFADISSIDNTGITLSNADCHFFRYGNSSVSELDVSTPRISVMAGFDGDIDNQGGDSHFLQRFSLLPHNEFDKKEAMKFALEHQNQLFAKIVTGGEILPEKNHSLISVSDSNVLLWALKPAEDGVENGGIVARLWNLGNSASNFGISSPGNEILRGDELTHVETPIANASIINGNIECYANANQMKTYGFFLNSDIFTSSLIIPDQRNLLKPFLKPNPAFETVQVFNLNGKGSIYLYNVSGQLVKKVDYFSNSCMINLKGLLKGIYIVKMKDNDSRMFSEKLIIK